MLETISMSIFINLKIDVSEGLRRGFRSALSQQALESNLDWSPAGASPGLPHDCRVTATSVPVSKTWQGKTCFHRGFEASASCRLHLLAPGSSDSHRRGAGAGFGRSSHAIVSPGRRAVRAESRRLSFHDRPAALCRTLRPMRHHRGTTPLHPRAWCGRACCRFAVWKVYQGPI